MKFRPHRGGLAEAMAEVEEVAGAAGIAAILNRTKIGPEVLPDQVRVKPYGYDSRIGWDTHVVTVDGLGVVGFTDGPLPELPSTGTAPE